MCLTFTLLVVLGVAFTLLVVLVVAFTFTFLDVLGVAFTFTFLDVLGDAADSSCLLATTLLEQSASNAPSAGFTSQVFVK